MSYHNSNRFRNSYNITHKTYFPKKIILWLSHSPRMTGLSLSYSSEMRDAADKVFLATYLCLSSVLCCLSFCWPIVSNAIPKTCCSNETTPTDWLTDQMRTGQLVSRRPTSQSHNFYVCLCQNNNISFSVWIVFFCRSIWNPREQGIYHVSMMNKNFVLLVGYMLF